MKPFTYADLSAGIGGFRIAFDSLGGHCVIAAERDPDKRKTYFDNFGETPFSTIQEAAQSPAAKDFDLLALYIPGQSFKDRNGKPENDLWTAFDLVDSVRPRMLLFDSSPKTFNKNLNFNGFGDELVEFLLEIGYTWFVSDVTSIFWVPQKKLRKFIVAFDPEQVVNPALDAWKAGRPKTGHPLPTIKCILDPPGPDVERRRMSEAQWRMRVDRRAREMKKGWPSFQVVWPGNIAGRTITASCGGSLETFVRDIPDKNPRRFTPREYARLAGFPEEHRVPDATSKVQKQAVRSPIPPMVRHIAAAMLALDQDEKTVHHPPDKERRRGVFAPLVAVPFLKEFLKTASPAVDPGVRRKKDEKTADQKQDGMLRRDSEIGPNHFGGGCVPARVSLLPVAEWFVEGFRSGLRGRAPLQNPGDPCGRARQAGWERGAAFRLGDGDLVHRESVISAVPDCNFLSGIALEKCPWIPQSLKKVVFDAIPDNLNPGCWDIQIAASSPVQPAELEPLRAFLSGIIVGESLSAGKTPTKGPPQ